MENSIKGYSLKSSSEFSELRQSGRKIFTSSGLLFKYKKNNLNHLRVGWTVPKYIGPAVRRNKLKRWGREACRINSDLKKLPIDVNVIFLRRFKDNIHSFKFTSVEQCFDEFYKKVSDTKI